MKSVLLIALMGIGWMGKLFWEVQPWHRPDPFLARLPLAKKLQQQAIRGVLGGLRPLVADMAWIRLVSAWERHQWFRVQENVWIATKTQPESVMFWDVGAWHLAWNAALDVSRDPLEPSLLKRLVNEKFWVNQGKEVLQEATIYHPDHYKVWLQLGWLQQERSRDYEAAFESYRRASELPGAPAFVGRLAGYALEKQGHMEKAKVYWKGLLQKTVRQQDREMIEKRLLKLEKDSMVAP